MTTLLSWLPSEFMVLGIVLIGLGLIVGLITLPRAATLLGFVFLLLLARPFLHLLLAILFALAPWWLLLLVGLFMISSLLGTVSRLVIGRRAADHMVGSLAADAVRFGFRMIAGLIALPLRLVFGGRR